MRKVRTGTLKLYTQARHPEHQARMGRGRGRGRRATDLTPLQWQQILADFDSLCAYCGATCNAEVEHLIPLGSGGEHSAWNVIPACRACNAARKTLPLDEWLNTLRRQGVSSIPLLERPAGQAKLAGLGDRR
jgi:5-methylcytosine-specific restriction endonuclease McrA